MPDIATKARHVEGQRKAEFFWLFKNLEMLEGR
jgi:hypothetical protein